MMYFKQHRSAERDAFSVPHSVQKSIPIKRIYQDGVFQVGAVKIYAQNCLQAPAE